MNDYQDESGSFNISLLSYRDTSAGAASSATEELDVLMASLSTFKVGRRTRFFFVKFRGDPSLKTGREISSRFVAPSSGHLSKSMVDGRLLLRPLIVAEPNKVNSSCCCFCSFCKSHVEPSWSVWFFGIRSREKKSVERD